MTGPKKTTAEGSRCAIRRTGVLIDVHDATAVIDVEGKVVRIPAAKLAEDIRAGDTLEWSGGLWTKVRNENGNAASE
ncbi:hypothetical protein [Paenibacillus humicola]|uniref:hypothetical protein n=1 Tax=Paenibacillus humicola TaxID=3110540 RepID=UPI00237AC1DA|nr:hypothetical protein [Paenibacillus humicola]